MNFINEEIRIEKPELILMYTWDIKGRYDNNICGHMYEIIDYYYILKEYFDIKIIFPDNYDLELVLDKYTFTLEEKIELSNCIIPRPKSGIIKTKNGNGFVLIVDGNLGKFDGVIYGIPIQFSCGKDCLVPKDKMKWYLLHDKRILTESKFERINQNPPIKTFNYNKRILFDKLKPYNHYIPKHNPEHFLFYLTKNCKYQSEEQINKIISKYILSFQSITIIIDYDFDLNKLNFPKGNIQLIDIRRNPIPIFSIPFTVYVYTDTKKYWDCSNRLVAECDYYNRRVLFLNKYQDQALVMRKFDIIKKDQLSYRTKEEACYMGADTMPYNLELTKNDLIIKYLFEILETHEY